LESVQDFIRERQRPAKERADDWNDEAPPVDGDAIPPFDLSGNWIEAYDVADVEGVKIEAIRQQRQAGRFQADRLAGIDADGRIWRRVRVNVESPGRTGRLKPSGRVSFWYLASTLAIAHGGAANGRGGHHGT
jgi:hypothetical protein